MPTCPTGLPSGCAWIGDAPLIALAGQPNMGKSTLFNLLTGLNQHVGNWPGKTVERREGHFDLDGRTARLVDLPGTYSLTANSPEEVIAREFILREQTVGGGGGGQRGQPGAQPVPGGRAGRAGCAAGGGA